MGATLNHDKLSINAGIDMHLDGRFRLLRTSQQLTMGASMSRLRSNDQVAYAFNVALIGVFSPNAAVPKPVAFPD